MLSLNVSDSPQPSSELKMKNSICTGSPTSVTRRLYGGGCYCFGRLISRDPECKTPWWQSVRALLLEHKISLKSVKFRSFFQSLCVLGYCIFPLVLAAVVAAFVRILWVRAPVAIGAWAWSVWGEYTARIAS